MHIYGPLWINSYGVMIVLGLLTFMYLSFYDSGREKIISDDLYKKMIFWGIIAGFIGGRLYVVITEWDIFSDNPWEVCYPWVGGLGIIGTIIGIFIGLFFYFRRNNIPMLRTFDLVALYTPVFQSIARLGCFFAGCCFGLPVATDAWLAVTYKNRACLAPLHIPLHPAQLYASAASFLIFVILYYGIRPRLRRPGFILWSYFMLESTARIFVEQWRADKVAFSSTLSSAQVCAAMLFVIGFVGFIYTLVSPSGDRKRVR